MTCPLVPDPLGVLSPMLLYMVDGGCSETPPYSISPFLLFFPWQYTDSSSAYLTFGAKHSFLVDWLVGQHIDSPASADKQKWNRGEQTKILSGFYILGGLI